MNPLVVILFLIILAGIGGVAAYIYYINPRNIEKNIDCIVSEWGECSQSGTQTRTIKTYSKGNGKDCPNLEQNCQPPPIPNVDCVTGEWSTCSPITRTRHKNIITQKSGNGKECGNISEQCIPDIDCKLSEWSECKAIDSNDKYQQIRTILIEKSGNGADCSLDRSKDCSISKKYEHFPQYDYPGNDIASFNSGTWGKCKDECDKYKDCVAFNYNMKNGDCNIKRSAKNGKDNYDWDVWVKSGTEREPSLNQPIKTKGSMTGVQIKNALGKCLEVDHAENGAWSRLKTCRDVNSQKWDYDFNTKQLKSHIRTGGNACLTMEGANHAWNEPYIKECNNSIEQKWSYDDNAKKIKRYSAEGNIGQCIAAHDNVLNGPAFRWECKSGDTAQEFAM